MILITDVKYQEVPRDIWEICHDPDIHPIYSDKIKNFSADKISLTKEVIYGDRFVTEDGKEVVLGFSEKVKNILGLPFISFVELQSKLNALERDFEYIFDENEKLKEQNLSYSLMNANENIELKKYKNMSFLKRLIFLFKGK